MEFKKLAGAVAATTVVFSIGSVAPASAADDQVFGIQQTASDPNGGEIAYTVSRLVPSGDMVPYPVSGQLYEATVRANAINGVVAPVIPSFSAQAESGQTYPALAGAWTPQGLSGAPLLFGGSTTGKLYFDVVGDLPNSVVYNGGAGDMLGWIEPPSAPPEEEASAPPEEEAGAPPEEEASAPPEGEAASGDAAESESSDSG